ncbi:MAG: deoxyribonuclease IV [Verrucomicrobia bacterium]|nr:deoxyribonuclease IV [Verrucomicrobiota bacterium]
MPNGSLHRASKRENDAPLLGAHMSIAGGPSKALERGRSIGCTAIQIFVKNNMQWLAKPFSKEELDRFHTFIDPPRTVFGHASYLINLSANNPDLLARSIQSLMEELMRAEQMCLPFLVLHPGAHMGDGERVGLARITDSLGCVFRALSDAQCKIALEITAGQGTTLGYRFEQLAEIISYFPSRLRACLDTAHLFAAGYDISSKDSFWRTVAQFDKIVGRDYLAAWHLNDSKAPLGARIDRHEHIGKGKIGLEPFREIMCSGEFRHIPKILETPKKEDLKEDVINLRVLKSLLENKHTRSGP